MLRWLLGEDFFISYARGDGLAYAAALGNALSAQGFSCFLDQWGSEPGREIPPRILRSLDRSAMLVLVGTPAAARSAAVEREVRRFLARRRGLVPISFGGALEASDWFDAVAGAAISHEAPAALEAGGPSPEVLSRIVNSFVFTRRNQRVRRAFGAAGVGLVALAATAGAASWQARREQAVAAEQRRLALAAQTEARTQQAIATAEGARATAAAASAAQAERQAREQQALAGERLRVARAAEWAGAARALAATDADLAALLAVRAHQEADTFEARRGLLAVLTERPLLKAQLVAADSGPGTSGPAGPGSVRSLWFDRTGRRLAVEAGRWQVFDLDRPGRATALAASDSLHAVVPAPDLQALAGVHWMDGSVRIRRAGQPEITIAPGDGGVGRLAWSPDGTRLAVGSSRGVQVWSGWAAAGGGVPVGSGFLGETSPADATRRHGVAALDFSADGSTVHWETRGGLRLAVRVVDGTPGEPLPAGVPRRRWLSATSRHLVLDDGDLRLIDGARPAEAPRLLLSEKDRRRDVQAAAIDASGSVAAAVMRDGQLRLFVDGEAASPVQAHVRPASAVAVAPDGSRLATGAEDGSVLLWERRPGALPQWAALPPAWRASSATLTMGLAWSADGRTLWAAGEDGVMPVDAASWRAPAGAGAPLRCGDTLPASLLALADGRLLVGGRPQRLHVLGAGRCGPALAIEQRNRWDTLTALAVSPDGRRVLSGDAGGQLLLWDLAAGRAELPAGAPRSIQTSSRSAVFSLLWQREGYRMDGEVALNTRPPPVPRAPDAAARDGSGEGERLAIDARGRILAAARGDVVSLRDPRSGREQLRWSLRPVPLLGIEQLALDPQGRWLAAGHRAGVTLIDVPSRQPLGILPLPADCPDCRPLALAFSPDGQWLAALMPGGVVRWPVTPAAWARVACGLAAGRALSAPQAATHGVPPDSRSVCASPDRQRPLPRRP